MTRRRVPSSAPSIAVRLFKSARLRELESKLAEEAERALVEATQRLCPEERINADLAHSRLVMQLHEAGRQLRSNATDTVK